MPKRGLEPAAQSRPDCEEQFVIVAAGHGCEQRMFGPSGKPASGIRVHRNGIGVQRDADTAGLGNPRDAVGETVAEVDARRRGLVAAEERPNAKARGRPEVALDARGRGVRLARLQHLQTCGCAANRPGEVDVIPRSRSTSRQRPSALHRADRRDVDRQRTWRAREVAADHGNACRCRLRVGEVVVRRWHCLRAGQGRWEHGEQQEQA